MKTVLYLRVLREYFALIRQESGDCSDTDEQINAWIGEALEGVRCEGRSG